MGYFNGIQLAMDAKSPAKRLVKLTVPLLASATTLLGAVVMLGWILHQPILVQFAPGYSPMVFATALGFVAIGSALFIHSVFPRGPRFVPATLALIVLGIGTATLIEHATGVSLGAKFPSTHSWFNNHPGRMALNAAGSFIVSAIAMLIAVYGRDVYAGTMILVMSFVIVLMGIIGVAGYQVRPELLYGLNINIRMALHTAVGFILLGIGLGVTEYRRLLRTYFEGRPDVKIGLLGGALLASTAVIAGFSAFVPLQRQSEHTFARSLGLALENRNEQIQAEVDRGIANAISLSTRTALRENLARLRANIDPDLSLQRLYDIAHSLTSQGLSAVRIYDQAGHEVTHSGARQEPALAVRLTLSEETDLIWQDYELRLRIRVPVADEDVTLGALLVERSLPAITRLLFDVASLGETAEMALCAELNKQIRCFPTRLKTEVFDVPHEIGGVRLPVTYALAGESGSIVTGDYRRQSVLAVYAPVGSLGLAAVLKLDTVELYRPVRKQLERSMLGLIVLTVIAIFVLRIAVMPLVRRVIASEQRIRQANMDLKESESRFRSITSSANDAIISADVNGRIVFWNEAAQRIFGYAEAEVLGQGLTKLMPERFKDAHEAGMYRFAETGEARVVGHTVELTGQRADRSEFPLELSLSSWMTGRGAYYTGIIRDITKRHTMEQRLASSEQRYRQLVDHSRGLICIHDLSGMLLYVNPVTADALGYPAAELVNMNLRDVIIPEARPLIGDYLARVTTARRDSGLMHIMTHSGERRIWMYDNVLIDEPGKAPYILGHAQDITDLRRAEAALRQSEVRFRTLAEQAPVGIVLTDVQGHVTYINEYWTQMTGEAPAQALGDGWVQRVHPDDRERVLDQWREAVSKGATFAGEFRFRSRAGRDVWTVVGAIPMREPDGSVSGYVATAMDISERKRAEEMVRELALVDELTGLYNRRGFMNVAIVELGLARRMNRHLWLFYADLNGMKKINDTFGHTVGDQALKDTAMILQKVFRSTDILTRLGGDEFAILSLETLLLSPESVIARLQAEIDAHNKSAGRAFQLSISVGAVNFEPAKHANIEQLLDEADAAMYQVKRGSGNAR